MMATVHAGRTFALSLLAGLIASGVLTALNLTIVQPPTSLLTDAILDELIADGEYDEDEFESKVQSIYFGQTAGSVIIGLAGGAVIRGVHMLGRGNTGSFVYAILIGGLAWFVLYTVPAAKFPPSPLAVFKGEAAAQYYPLYFGYLAVSGLAALGIVLGFRRVASKNKILGMAAVYFVVIAIAFLAFPNYSLDSTLDQKLVSYWRASVSASLTAFWFSAGAIAGLLWKYGSATNKTSD